MATQLDGTRLQTFVKTRWEEAQRRFVVAEASAERMLQDVVARARPRVEGLVARLPDATTGILTRAASVVGEARVERIRGGVVKLSKRFGFAPSGDSAKPPPGTQA